MSTISISEQLMEKNKKKLVDETMSSLETEDGVGEIFLEKFIALNPLYYMDEEEEYEYERCGFSSESTK